MFTSLHHLIDIDWVSEAYRRTRKDGATGIDGVTAADYAKDLEANLESLLSRIKSGSYRAPPVRRHYIPKADGTKRPLGIPTFLLIRDTPPAGMYVLNMFCIRGSRLWGSRLHRACVV